MPVQRRKQKEAQVVAGLFAGIGGIEVGLANAGHRTALVCEIDEPASAVLRHQLDLKPVPDIRRLKNLPREVSMITAGFPCQDLSQAGQTQGLSGSSSGLIGEVFRLLERRRIKTVLLENVPFMLRLRRGAAMNDIVQTFENLGYTWAYRVVNSLGFGLPQRRKRVYFLAMRDGDPRDVLLSEESLATSKIERRGIGEVACGFYWTEGNRGLGWAANSVPTLKGGSTIGIPSPPAIVLKDGNIVTPDIRDAERLQGFPADWTLPVEKSHRPSLRWKLVGNAVTVPVAQWIGERLRSPIQYDDSEDQELRRSIPWPTAAWGQDGERWISAASEFPRKTRRASLERFLVYTRKNPKLLSRRATSGFYGRLIRSTLRIPPGFEEALSSHLNLLQSSVRPE